jgi:ABC-type branched-subunit amino acid transport system ATPase component
VRALIEVVNVSKRYGSNLALSGIQFTIEEEKLLWIGGPKWGREVDINEDSVRDFKEL